MNKLIPLTFGIIAAIAGAVGLAMSLNNINIAEKNLGYEYGRCVFYDQISVEKCNVFSKGNGLAMYEKYYGDGSWTVEADPMT